MQKQTQNVGLFRESCKSFGQVAEIEIPFTEKSFYVQKAPGTKSEGFCFLERTFLFLLKAASKKIHAKRIPTGRQ